MRLRRAGALTNDRVRRGALEIGLVVVTCALVAGAVFGAGFAQTVLATPDSLTWLRSLRGELTRVNPDTGTPVERLPVSPPGTRLHVTQGDGVLVVTDLDSNKVTVIDMSMLRIGGIRPARAGQVKVLLANRQIYLADLKDGSIERMDALTAATIGKPWRSEGPLADVAADAAGAIYALDGKGRLAKLEWSATPASIVERERRQLSGAGADAVLVAHDHGVTAVDPQGTITQIGTGEERSLRASGLTPPLVAAENSPAGLVPVSSPASDSIHLVRSSRVVEVDTGPLACKPGKPVVYMGRIYAPCVGGKKVVVLDPEGHRARDDLDVPGEAELVVNAGLLIINVPTAETGLVVLPDGTAKPIRTHDPRVPVIDPTARPTAPPNDAGNRQNQQPQTPEGNPRSTAPNPTGTQATGPTAGPSASASRSSGSPSPSPSPSASASASPSPSPSRSPSPTPSPSPSPSARAEDYIATGVTAQANRDSTITVAWTPPPIRPTSYRILRTDTGAQVATATTGAAFAIVGGQPLGQSVTFIVESVTATRSYQSAPSNPVSAYGRPGGPNVGIQLLARGPTKLTLRVTVDVVTDGGSPVTTYDLTVTDAGSGRTLDSVTGVPIGQNSRQFDVTCSGVADLCLSGGTVTASATLSNNAGAGPPSSAGATIDPPPTFNVNENQPVMLVSAGGKCLDRDLRLHTCTGATSQFWTPKNTGDITSAVNADCLAHNRGPNLSITSARNDECRNREDSNRWVHERPNGNQRHFRGDGRSVCIAVIGDPAGEGTPVNLLTCQYTDQDRWYLFKQTPGLPIASVASAAPSANGQAADAPLGELATAALLMPLALGLVRLRRPVTRRRRP